MERCRQDMQSYGNQPNQFGWNQPSNFFSWQQCPPNYQGGYMNNYPPNFQGFNYQQNFPCYNGQMMPQNYGNYHPNMASQMAYSQHEQSSYPFIDDHQFQQCYRKMTQGHRRPYNPNAIKYNVQ